LFAAPQEASVQNVVSASTADESRLTIDRIFVDKDFQEERFGQLTWSKSSSSYFTFKPTATEKKGRDLVRVDCESGKETVVASARGMTIAIIKGWSY